VAGEHKKKKIRGVSNQKGTPSEAGGQTPRDQKRNLVEEKKGAKFGKNLLGGNVVRGDKSHCEGGKKGSPVREKKARNSTCLNIQDNGGQLPKAWKENGLPEKPSPGEGGMIKRKRTRRDEL